MKPSVLVLGSGQDGGSPQLGQATGVGGTRTASSVAVRSPNGSIVLLDASPDIRSQGSRLLAWAHYPSDRSRFVDAVALTHGHMGHYAGLLHFGKEAANAALLPLLATASMLAFLTANEPWRTLTAAGHLRPYPLDGEVPIDTSLSVAGIGVPHRAEFTDTVALSIVVRGAPWFLYLPDIDSWDAWPDAEEVIAAHDIALLDATFSSSSELPGRDMEAIAHPLVPDTIARFKHLTSTTRIVLGHINHSNQLADPLADVANRARDQGFMVAHDGLEL